MHPSHRTRISFDASTYDEICELCGATDVVPGGWGKLALPCSAPRDQCEAYDREQEYRRLARGN